MSYKRKSMLVLTIGLVLFYLVGPVSSAKKVTISFETELRLEEYAREAVEALRDRFHQAYPNVEVEFLDVEFSQMVPQALLKAQTGKPPDVMEGLVSWIPKLTTVLEPVKNWLEPDEIAQYSRAVLNDTTYEGEVYGVVFFIGPICLYVNKEYIQEAGYSVRGPSDLIEFREMVEKIDGLGLTREGQKVYSFALRSDKSMAASQWFFPWLWAHGGQIADRYGNIILNSIATRNTLRFYHWLAENDYIAKGVSAAEARQIFEREQAGFMMSGPWGGGFMATETGDPNFGKKYITAMMPRGVTGESRTLGNHEFLAVFKGSKHKKEAADWIRFITLKEESAELVYKSAGLPPGVPKFLETLPVFQTEFVEAFSRQLPYSIGTPIRHPGWLSILDVSAVAYQRAIKGDDVRAIAEDYENEVKQIVGQ